MNIDITKFPHWLKPPLKDQWMVEYFDIVLFSLLAKPAFKRRLNLIKDPNSTGAPIEWAANGDKFIRRTDNIFLCSYYEPEWMVNSPTDPKTLTNTIFIELRVESDMMDLRAIYIPETHFYLIPYYFKYENGKIQQVHSMEHLAYKIISRKHDTSYNLEIYCL